MPCISRRIVRGLQEGQQCFLRVGGLLHNIVRQQELSHFLTVKSAFGLNWLICECGSRGVCVGIKGRVRVLIVTGPEPAGADFLRIRFLHHFGWHIGCGAGVLRRIPAGKARHRHIKSSPEKMHRAALPREPGAEARKRLCR